MIRPTYASTRVRVRQSLRISICHYLGTPSFTTTCAYNHNFLQSQSETTPLPISMYMNLLGVHTQPELRPIHEPSRNHGTRFPPPLTSGSYSCFLHSISSYDRSIPFLYLSPCILNHLLSLSYAPFMKAFPVNIHSPFCTF